MSSSQFLTGSVKTILFQGEIGGKGGKFALASGEEGGRNLARSTVRRTTS